MHKFRLRAQGLGGNAHTTVKMLKNKRSKIPDTEKHVQV
jgi:hypothetical protein